MRNLDESTRLSPVVAAQLGQLMFCCEVCGKETYKHYEDWGWKVGSRLCCSYTCMRKLERQMEENQVKRRTQSRRGRNRNWGQMKTPESVRRDIVRLVQERQDLRYKDIAELLGVSAGTVAKVTTAAGISRSTGRKANG